MPKKALETLTESMFYVLMSLLSSEKCGIEITSWIEKRTNGRVSLGPATLYTVLAKFEKESYIKEISVEGRKRTYCITELGKEAFNQEVQRLQQCLNDVNKGDDYEEEMVLDTLQLV